MKPLAPLLAAASFLTLSGPSALAESPASANANAVSEEAFQIGRAQESLQALALQLRQELAQAIQEFEANNLQTDQLRKAAAALEQLDSVSERDMTRALEALHQAAASSSSSEAADHIASASQAQKTVRSTLDSLADRLALQQNQSTIRLRIESLASRQRANLRATSSLNVPGLNRARLNADQSRTLLLASSEQRALRDEILQLQQRLASLAQRHPQSPFPQILHTGQARNLTTLAETAARETEATRFNEAIPAQSAIQDTLLAFLSTLDQATPAAQRLQNLQVALAANLTQQKELQQRSAQATPEDAPTLAAEQQRLADRTAILQKQAAALDPQAAQALAQASQSMEASSQALQTPLPTRSRDQAQAAETARAQAATHQQAAQQSLQEANAALEQLQSRLASATPPPASPSAQLAELQRLDQAIRQAAVQAEALAQTPPNQRGDNQEKLAQQISQLQAQALQQAPAASPHLGQAASHLQDSAQPQAPRQAAQALAQASQQLQPQLEALRQQAAQQAAAQQLASQLSAAQQAAQQATQSIQSAPPKADLTQAWQQLSQAQKALQQTQSNRLPAGTPPQLSQTLTQAQNALQQAAQHTAQGQRQEAVAAAQKAINALAQAQQKLTPPTDPAASATESSLAGSGGTSDLHRQQPGASEMQNFGTAAGTGTGLARGALKPKERAALASFQSERVPPEYRALVDQYMKNLAESP